MTIGSQSFIADFRAANRQFDCPIAPIEDYANNPIFHELPTKNDYFPNSDKRIYIDLRNSKGCTNEIEKLKQNYSNLVLKIELKNTLTKNMHLRVWGYSHDKYLYILTDRGLTVKYKTHTVVKDENLTS